MPNRVDQRILQVEMTSKEINVGVVGYGWAATAHIDAIQSTLLGQVTAICSARARELDAAEISARHGAPIKLFENLEEMLLDDEIHVVDITSYPTDHRKHAVAVAEAGKHLIVEKPLALSWEDCQAIQSAVQAAGVRCCVCLECRFSSQLTTTKSLIDQGLLGNIHYGEIDYYHGIGPWYGQYRWNVTKECGGSSLLSAGCHALDALIYCMGSDIKSVTSFTAQSDNSAFSPYEYPTTSVSVLRFTDGRVGKTASVIDCLQPYYFRTHLVGSEGSLLDNKFYSTKLGALSKNRWSELSMPLLDSGDVSDHPYQAQFESFFNSLYENKSMPLTNLDEACRTFKVVFACDRSASEGGREVKLAEFDC